MDNSPEADKLLAEINRRLPLEQQIQRDDPLCAAMALNRVALECYVQEIRRHADEIFHNMTISSEQYLDRAEAIADRLISKSGNKIERQVEAAAQRCEVSLKKVSADAEANIERATWLAWIGATLILCYGGGIVGTWLGNWLYDSFLSHRPRPAVCQVSHHSKGKIEASHQVTILSSYHHNW